MLLKLIICIMLMIPLAGCKESGRGDSAVLGGIYGSGNPIDGGGTSIVRNNPEPVTTVLLGSGLIAYAFLKRKKRK